MDTQSLSHWGSQNWLVSLQVPMDPGPQSRGQSREVPISVYQNARAEETSDFSNATLHGPFSGLPYQTSPSQSAQVTVDRSLSLPHIWPVTDSSWPSPHRVSHTPPFPTPPLLLSSSHPYPPSLHSCSRLLAGPTLLSTLHPAILVIFQRGRFSHASSQLKIRQ